MDGKTKLIIEDIAWSVTVGAGEDDPDVASALKDLDRKLKGVTNRERDFLRVCIKSNVQCMKQV